MILNTGGASLGSASAQDPYTRKIERAENELLPPTYFKNDVTGGRGSFNANVYNNTFAQYYNKSTSGAQPTNVTGGRGSMNPNPSVAAAYFATVQELNAGTQQPQKSNFQQWAEGNLSGAQMRAKYGRNWKDKYHIRPKRRSGRSRTEKNNAWMPGGVSEPTVWRIG